MSKTIDEKVVEMRFDNRHFETNVRETMSTLDKLKAKLNLSGATKGIDDVSRAAGKFNLNGMTSALETVSMKFSALEVIGVTALVNITNKAVDAGLALVKNLSVGQLSAGWKKYDEKIGSVQTIMNATGKSIDEVNEYLEKLMWYSDETSYGFTDMTKSIAQMTSSGGNIDKVIPLVMGVANATAYAGKNAEAFSHAIYNLNQSYSGGYLQYRDWFSMNNVAGIGSKQLQQTLIDTAVSLGKIKEGEVTLENFGHSLQKQWADREVMEAGFGKFATAMEEAYRLVKEGKFETAAAALDSLDGHWDELSLTASKAAQNAKTFKEVIDYTADAMSSNWMTIWEAIFGNYEQARDMWSNLAEVIYEHFVAPLEHFRDRVVAIMKFNPISSLMEKIENSGIGKVAKKIESVSDSINETAKSLEYYQDMVTKIWRGDYKNQPYRKGLLEAEGHNFSVLQTLVNKGYQYKLTIDDVAEAEREFGIEIDRTSETIEEVTENLEDLSDERLRDAGLTEKEIKQYRSLEKIAKSLGKSITEVTGRDLLIGSFANLGNSILTIIESIKNAWKNVFPEKSEFELFSILESIYNFTYRIKEHIEKIAADSEEKLSPLTRTLRGLFSIIHIIATAIKTVFKAGFKILEGVLSVFNISILDVTAAIGDIIYNLDRWLTENNVFVEALKTIGIFIGETIKKIAEWIQQNEKIMSVINQIKEAFNNAGSAINAWIEGLKSTENVPEYIFGGLINGIKDNGPKVFDAIIEVAKGLISAFCNVLGIHSPSKVMYAIGGFLIAGLIGGLSSGTDGLFGYFKNIADTITNIISHIDLGNIIAVGISGGIIYVAKRMLDIADKLLAPIQGLTNIMNGLSSALSGVGAAARDFGKSMKYQGVAAIIKSIAISIGVLALSLFVLAKLPADQLKQGAIALGIIAVVLGAFIGVIALLSDKLSKVKFPDIGKTLAVIIGVSVGMLIMAKALKSIAKINPDRMLPAIAGLIGCAAAMAILVITLSKVTESLKGTKNLEKMGKIFIKISLSMLLLSVALRLMSKVKTQDLKKAGLIFGGLVVLLITIGVINKFTADSLNQAADTIKAVGITLLLLVIAMRLCGKLETKDFLKGLAVIGVFTALLTAMMVISKIFKGTEMIKVTSSILMAAVAIGILAIIVKLLSNMEPDAMKKGLICVSILGVLVTALIAVSKNSASFHGTTLIGVAMVIAVMGIMVFLLGQLDPEKAKNGLIAVGFITAFVSVLLQAAKNFNPGANSVKTLTTLTFMLALLAVSLVALSFIDSSKLMKTAGSLGAVMLALAAVIYSTSKMKIDKGVIKTLFTITLVVAALAGIIALLSHFTDPHSAIIYAGSLSLLLLACGGLLTILSKIKLTKTQIKNATQSILALTTIAVPLLAFVGVLKLMEMANLQNCLSNVLSLTIMAGAMTGLVYALSLIANAGLKNIAVGVLGLTMMAIPLLAFVGILKLMSNIDQAMENVLALTVLASAMTLLLIPLTLLGALAVGTGGMGALAIVAGILALTAMAVPLLAFVGILAMMSGIENAEENARVLTTMVEKIGEMLFKISLVAPLAIIADAAILGLIGVITTIGVMAVAVGALMNKFPQLQEFLNNGLPVLEQIGTSIGRILGNIVAGFTMSIADTLPYLGTKLSEFMVNADGFIKGSSNIPSDLGNRLGGLALGILALTGANLLDSIATFLSGGDSFSRLGIELSNFATNAKDFLDIVGVLDPNVMQGAKNLADAVLAFVGGNFLNEISSWLTGDNDLAAFGEKLPPLGTGLKDFANNLGEFSESQITSIQNGCEALKSIAEAAKSIPNEGGLLALITGDNDIQAFAAKFGDVGKSLRGFVWELQKDNIFTSDKMGIIDTACNVLKSLIDVAKQIPNTGGLVSLITGDNDIQAFAAKFGDVAKSIRGFVWELQKDNVFREDSIDKVYAVNNLLYAIANLGNIDLGNLSGKLEELGARLGSFANKLNEYIGSINLISMDDLEANEEKVNKIIEISNLLASVSSEPIENLGASLKTFVTEALKDFVDTLNAQNLKDDCANAIKNVIDAIIKAVDEKRSDIKNKFNEIGEEAYQGLNWDNDRGQFRYFSFNNLGKNFVEGFANGIRNNLYLARDAGSSVGRKALEAAKESIDSNSPSKETYKLGTFFDEGFINGIRSLSDKIYDETYGVGNNARLGLSRAIQGVSNLITEGIDDEFTIRPILDLSNVEAGASTINGILGNSSVGLSANLDAISSGMRTYRQNGGEEQVVSAIDRLSKNLGNNGDTYNINGVSYSDNAEISEAVQTLVRAARIERRT